MEEKNSNKNSSQPEKEKEFNKKIENEFPDLTGLVFDLFFDKEFKGNIDPSEDMAKKKVESE